MSLRVTKFYVSAKLDNHPTRVFQNDSADLAQKLAVLLRDANLRKQLGRQGRQNVFEKFSSERMACATLNVLRTLTKNHAVKESSNFPLDALTPLA